VEKTENSIVGVAIQTGENNAAIDNLEEQQQELEQKQENVKMFLRWTQQDVDNLYNRMSDLENRLAALEAAEVIEEIEEEQPAATEEETETTLENPPEEKSTKKKSGWNFFF